MTTSQLSLDPRKTPWKRGDLCTLDFKKKTGFVLNHTPEYLEVRWTGGGIERIATQDIDDVTRVMHADSLSPAGKHTNLESLEAIESISRVKNAIAERMKTVKSEDEKRELDALIKRSFGPECTFDRKHSKLLFHLAIDPQRVSWYWKLRERWHRFVHHH